ncbi:MAG: M48 family metalloprotease, partial [Candidatus Odinarchaeota archaeon]|nr:M48 family metalloprotease [Candidatus Odinarchaeota archaeon]
IGMSTLFVAFILSNLALPFNAFTLISYVIVINLVQWLIAPYIIDKIYNVKEVKRDENPWLYTTVERLSGKMGIKMPKVMIANIPIPNAFAYGSIISGSRIALTSTLIKTLNRGEIEAVIGHELGHLKHKDAQIMMFVSLLPAIFYYIGYYFIYSSYYGNDREGSALSIIGLFSLVFYFILSLFGLFLSRQREYYADYESATNVERGAEKLSTALVKINTYYKTRNRTDSGAYSSFRALFISDPFEKGELAVEDAEESVIIEKLSSRKLSFAERLVELFSTHPNIVNRLKALRELATA